MAGREQAVCTGSCARSRADTTGDPLSDGPVAQRPPHRRRQPLGREFPARDDGRHAHVQALPSLPPIWPALNRQAAWTPS
jgi:hypothetical protein